MPCMCGDTCCPSCGPAQGNYKCPACGNWASDGGCEDPQACNKICAEMDEHQRTLEDRIADQMAEEYKWQDEHAAEIAEAIRRKD